MMMPATTNDTDRIEDDLNNQAAGGKTDADKKSKARMYTEFALPSERVDKDKHLPLLKNAVAFSQFGKLPVTAEQMEQGVSTQAARLTVNYFVEIGLLTKTDRKYLPTQACIDIVRAFALGDTPKVRTVLRALLAPTWFAEGVLARLAVDGRAAEERLVTQLAVTAGVIDERDQKVKARSFRILLAYLVDAGLVAKEGEEFVLPDNSSATMEPGQVQGSGTLASVTAPPLVSAATPASMGGGSSAITGRVSASVPAASQSSTTAPEGWFNRSTPGFYELRVKPDPRALKMLEAVLAELRITVELTQENDNMFGTKESNREA